MPSPDRVAAFVLSADLKGFGSKAGQAAIQKRNTLDRVCFLVARSTEKDIGIISIC